MNNVKSAPEPKEKLVGTGKYVTAAELFTATQLFGKYHSDNTMDNRVALNGFLKNLGIKYKYNWIKHQIQPDTGEIIEVVKL